MPFKDTWGHTMPSEGWSPLRAKHMGASMLEAIAEVLPFLRAEFPFNNGGIGSGKEPEPWNTPGYKNPMPTPHVFNV